MIESLENLRAAARDGPCVAVTLVAMRGSTPREAGAQLVAGFLGGCGGVADAPRAWSAALR